MNCQLSNKKKFGTQGKLFYDKSAFFEKLKIWQQEWMEKIRSIRIIENAYSELTANISKMLKDGRSHIDIAKEVGLSEKKTKENLYSTTSGKPTISTLVKKILGDSDAAKNWEFEMVKDSMTRLFRGAKTVFHKLKKYKKSERIRVVPTDPVQLHEDE